MNQARHLCAILTSHWPDLNCKVPLQKRWKTKMCVWDAGYWWRVPLSHCSIINKGWFLVVGSSQTQNEWTKNGWWCCQWAARWLSCLSSWSVETISELPIMLFLVLGEFLPRYTFIQESTIATAWEIPWARWDARGSLKKGVERTWKQFEKWTYKPWGGSDKETLVCMSPTGKCDYWGA